MVTVHTDECARDLAKETQLSMTLLNYHFSVDDVLDCLLEVSDQSQPPFEHPFFGFLKELHDDFGAIVDLYLFLGQPGDRGGRSLSEASASLRPIFRQSPWLRWGPHALDTSTPPHAQSCEEQQACFTAIYQQIARFAGEEHASHWVRLHYFSESYELSDYFRSQHVNALLTTDKPAASYRLPPVQKGQLRTHGTTQYSGMRFVRSLVRVENLAGHAFDDQQLDDELDRLCFGSTCAVVFTHEYELARPEVREMTRRVFSWIHRRKLLPVGDTMHPSNMLQT